ncbi:MAG: radical SAM protein, partial [Desulfatitalea sp.]|nr:radical SAM protein [Desulfatitalea sp.]NNK01664.1 radical SAM protein [Desulfatitalea sp.]
LEGYAAVGADGPLLSPLTMNQSRVMPFGSELMYLPDRIPLLYDLRRTCITAVDDNPHTPGQPIFPVAVFNSPGHVVTHACAYKERQGAGLLPLFSYGAVGWRHGKFHSATACVDDEPRQDLRRMPLAGIQAGVRNMRRQLPHNRLRVHLERCALVYGCPAGKNFFLGRYEAPLPTARTCNARCLGCISLQPDGCLPSSQDRITFTPSPREIAEVALAHIEKVPDAVVSFGQGCEGDPLMAADTITEAIRMIRAHTHQGTINMNTNGSLPEKIDRLLAAGLDSLRISMNSVRKTCYEAYFRPNGYVFEDVLATIALGLAHKSHLAINYLNCPGFTDTPEEYGALVEFLARYPVHMIQWRNLNFDPLHYLRIMNDIARHTCPMGMSRLLEELSRRFPALAHGYFNPPKSNFRVKENR